MPIATVQFTKTDDYILAPAGRLQLALHALPPAGAALDIAVYSAPLGQDSGFRQIVQARIASLGVPSATAQYAIPINAGLAYVFRLEGDARLLLPGLHAMTVGLSLTDSSGEIVHDFGNQALEATHALLDGLFYVKPR